MLRPEPWVMWMVKGTVTLKPAIERVVRAWLVASVLGVTPAWAQEVTSPSDGTAAAEEEQTVVVRGVLPATATASQVTVSDREIEAIPVRSAEDALRLVPGLVMVQHGSEGKGHQFFLRGFDAVHGTDLEI